jgi:hypothetical protein
LILVPLCVASAKKVEVSEDTEVNSSRVDVVDVCESSITVIKWRSRNCWRGPFSGSSAEPGPMIPVWAMRTLKKPSFEGMSSTIRVRSSFRHTSLHGDYVLVFLGQVNCCLW